MKKNFLLFVFYVLFVFQALSQQVTVSLNPSTPLLNEVEIFGSPASENSFRTEEIHIGALKKTNVSDVGNLLRQVANVSGIRKGATGIDPVVRGFKYSQLNVQVDGASIEGGCPNRMDPPTAHLDLNDISNIKVLKGPFALKYGANFGGLILITRFQPVFHNHFENHVNLSAGGQTNYHGEKTGVRIFGGNKMFFYEVSGHQSKYGDYTAGNGATIPGSFNRTGFATSVGFRLTKNQIVSVDADISNGKNIDFPTLSMDERKDNTRLFDLHYEAKEISQTIKSLHFNAYRSVVHHDMDNKNRPFSDTVVAVSIIDAVNTGLKFSTEVNAFQGIVDMGGDVQHIDKDGQRDKTLIMQPGLPLKQENLWNKAHIDNLGFYSLYKKKSKKIGWTIAMRLDFNTAGSGILQKQNAGSEYYKDSVASHFLNFSFSGGVSWQFKENQYLNISVGSGTRSPNLTERFIVLLPVGMDPYDYIGNPQLKPETNHEMDLGYRTDFKHWGSINASVFFSYVTRYISARLLPPAQIKPATRGLLGVKQFTNIPKAYLTGFEFSWYSPLENRWQLLVNSSYTTGINPKASKPVMENGHVVDQKYIGRDPLPEIPPFETDIRFKYRFLAHRLVPEAKVRIVAAQNLISEAFMEKTTPGFATVDLGIHYQYNQYLSLYYGINNLFNKAYYEHLNRITVSNRAPLFEPGRLFYFNLFINF